MLERWQATLKETISRWAIEILHINSEGFWIEAIRYGAGMLIISAINTPLLVLILFYLLRLQVQDILPFVITYNVLRCSSFGAHADSIALCTFVTTSYYVGGILLGQYIIIPFPIGIIVCAVVFILFMRYAPAETKHRPLSNNRFLFRILSLILVSVSIYLYIWLKIQMQDHTANLILVAMCCQSINLTPFMYTLLERKD